MQRSFFILLFASLIALQSSAQKRDTVFYYMKGYGTVLKTADSAEFVRVIVSPEKDDKTGLFTVTDIYRNGKKKMSGKSHSSLFFLSLEGPVITYYTNGRRESIINYENTLPVGQAIRYYPNGQLYAVTKMENRQLTFVECHDTTGRVLAENGDGTWLDYTNDYSNLYQQGPVVKGVRQGNWKKFIDGKDFPFQYQNGKVVLTANSERTSEIISKPDIPASVQGGKDVFLDYLQKSVRYPGIARENSLTGVVWVSYIVEKDATLSDVKADPGASRSLDEEAIRAVKDSPLIWIPAFLNGKPVRSAYKIAICYELIGLPPVQPPLGSIVVTTDAVRRTIGR